MTLDKLPTLGEIKDLIQIFISISRWGKDIILKTKNFIIWHGNSKEARDIASAFYKYSWNNLQQTKPEIKKIGWIDRPEINHILNDLENERNSIILHGEAGSGKSGIALEIGQKSVNNGNPILFIRATDFPKNQDPIITLQNRLSIEIPLLEAISIIGKERNLFIIIDQLDSVAGTELGKYFVTFLKSIVGIPNIDILVVTRTYELNNDPDIQTLDFNKIESGLLTKDEATGFLSRLGITDHSETLIEIASNLLNLSIISEIVSENSTSYCEIDSEVKLWKKYIESIKEREGDEVAIFIEDLARITITQGERDFQVRFPNSHVKRSVLSRGILLNTPGRRYKFRHEQIQDFLCAYSLLPENKDLNTILTEFNNKIPIQILSWLQKLYHEEKLHNEEYRLVNQILKEDKLFQFYSRVVFLENLKQEKKPSTTVAKVISDNRNNYAYMRYFFRDLENPNWIGPLNEIGFFTNVPGLKEVKKSGVQAQPWPAGDYLKIFANDYEDTICSIVSTIRTENWIVVKKLTELLIKISPEKARDIISIVDSWLDNKWSLRMLPADLLPLADSFVESGYIEEAILMLNYIIRPVFNKRKSNFSDPHVNLRFRSENYEVSEYFSKQFPKLVQADPEGLVKIFSSQLEEAIKFLTQLKNEKIEEFSGYYWRLDIPSDPSSKESLDAYDLLINGLRDSLLALCNQSAELGKTYLIKYLSSHHIIFQRISLYVLRHCETSFPELIDQALINRDFFEKQEYKAEYQGLLRDHFEIASKDAQNQVIKWILLGPPDIKDRASRYAQIEGRSEVTKEDRQKANDEWIQRYLSIIGGELPQEAREKLLELDNKYGKKNVREKPVIEFGPLQSAVSPISSEELAKMTFEELQDFFINYEPDDTFLNPREALAKDFKLLVQNNPIKYTNFASYLNDPRIHFSYIFNFFLGLQEGWKKVEGKIANEILDLCEATIRIEKDTFLESSGDYEPGLQAAQRSTASFLEQAMHSDDHYLSREMLDRIRNILITLAHHKDPEPSTEKKSNFDPLTQSINYIRGIAMHGLINHSLYVNRQTEKQTGKKKEDHNIEQEIITVLEEKLDKSKDPSLGVHAVFGAHFSQLYYLSPEWAERNLEKIFIPQKENIQYWKAAWDAYIVWSGFSPKVFQLLIPQYQRGLRWLSHPEFKTEYFGTSPDERLAQHVMNAYLINLTDLGNENEPLVLLFNNGPDEIRSQAIFWLSQVLKDSKPKENNPIWIKCWNLWQHRVEAAEREDISKNTLEISNYIRWLDHCPLGFETLYPILLQSIKYFNINYHSIKLISYAAENCENYPLKAIKLLQETIIREKESWWRPNEEDERKILRTALMNENPVAKQIAIEVINHHGESGDFRWKDLLNLA